MLALNKDVCLLKDQTLRTLHADLVGKLYRVFDPLDPIETIPKELTKWLRDKKIVPSTVSIKKTISISLTNLIPNSSDLVLPVNNLVNFSDLTNQVYIDLQDVVEQHTY